MKSCETFSTVPIIVPDLDVGTHRDGNFQSRMAEHFLFDERKMAFTQGQPAPQERSIFRKHIGRALLTLLFKVKLFGRKRSGSPFRKLWGGT